MRIRVLFFGVLRDSFPAGEQSLELDAPATAGTVLSHYRAAVPAHGALWNAVALAVNQHYASRTTLLAEGDEVALLPPVSGGAGEREAAPALPQTPEAAQDSAWLTRDPIDAAALVRGLKAGEDGAVVVFDGIVRNHTRGRATLSLDYQAYEVMALAEMRSLAAQAVARFPVRQVLLVHRLGRLSIGETSVLIAVASAHRGAAFDACRWLIDTLKQTVPIWKKEYFADGAVWAAGEPFPEEIAPGTDA
ncbi:MAG TPA: molybdenum cofactor biosynthesis protein MoaE [Acidobacteriaceae bacterium]